ncbi:MAG: class I SAM-dependent rRNA methyltransferase [Thermodesulfobacteriaceae bacterium]|nr:class I SAM-dependent rRNA methyltransferase [Thermodesulfobacteriaceae bacterium]
MERIILNSKGLSKYLKSSLWFTLQDIKNPQKVSLEPGGLVKIYSEEGHFLGKGYFNPNTYYSLKILTKEDTPIDKEFFKKKFLKALELRKRLYPGEKTFRLIFSEGDFLPGLMVDVFEKVVVVQIQTLGMEKLKEHIISALKELLEPQAIVLRNDFVKRKEEALNLYVEIGYGKVEDPLVVEIDEIKFLVSVLKGQKTGFFLDQRENRRWISNLAKEAIVLDVFSYTGAFSFYALKGGAQRAFLIESSEEALNLAKEIAKLNNFTPRVVFLQGEALNLLRNPPKADLIVVDPPAFIKSHKHFESGIRKYKSLYLLSLKAIERGLVFLFSCSYFLKRELFLTLIKDLLQNLQKEGRIIFEGRQAGDHPVNPFVEETFYLKGVGIAI